MTITKENLSDNWKIEEKLDKFVQALDPNNRGRIDFKQFVEGIKKLTSDDNNTLMNASDFNYDNTVINQLQISDNLSIMNKSDNNLNMNTNSTGTMAADSLSLIDYLDRKSNSSPFSSSNDTFNEYDTESQLASNNSNRNSMQSQKRSLNDFMNSPSPTTTSTNLLQSLDNIHANSTNGSSQKLSMGYTSFNDDSKHDCDHSLSRNNDNVFEIATYDEKNLHDLEPNGQLLNMEEYYENTKSSSNANDDILDEIDAREDEEGDPFGFDPDEIINHQKSLSTHSFSSLVDSKTNLNSLPNLSHHKNRTAYFSSRQRAKQLFHNSMHYSNSENTHLNDSHINNINSEHEQIIEKYEQKIKEVCSHNDSLILEKNDLLYRINKLNMENSSLTEKVREMEEASLDQERKNQIKIEEEKYRQQEIINKLNLNLREERDNFSVQINNLEMQINFYKEENSKYLKIITDINKKIELTDEKLNEEADKFNNLKNEFQRILKEKEIMKEKHENEKIQQSEKIELLLKELDQLNVKLQIQNQKPRANTIYINDETLSTGRVKELEFEMKQLKTDNSQLNQHIDELNAQILRNNVDNGRMLLHLTANNSPSLAAEMDTMSKDDLMQKIRREQQITQRLREYVDNLLSKIMEQNPEMLEVTQSYTSSSLPPSLHQSSSSSGKTMTGPNNTTHQKLSQFRPSKFLGTVSFRGNGVKF